MGTTDPRLLISALADLQDECSRWATEARENLEEAHHVQRRQEEVVQLTHRRALIVTSEANDDRDKVERAVDDAATLLSQCQEAQQTATDLLAAGQEGLQMARQTLAVWESELEEALQWLARALARLEVARAELAAAEWALQAAKGDLDHAIWALRRCKGDEKRSNCWPEQAAVQAAQQQVQLAEYRRGVALEEVNAAEEEVEQARARVACCQQAVAFAGKAVQSGVEAVGRAEQALVAAEKSLDDAQAASKLAHKAKVDVDAELAEAEQMVIATRHAERFAYEAERSRRRADDANQTAQRLLAGSRMELDERIRHLRELNRPSSISYLRRSAVSQAWKQEMDLVRTSGTGTRNWKKHEIRSLRQGQKIKGIVGHHIRSVNGHSPKWAKDPRNIELVTWKEHIKRHGGHFRNPTTGKLIDRQKLAKLATRNRQPVRSTSTRGVG